MEKKNWLDFVSVNELKKFFESKLFKNCDIKFLNDKKFGKIINVITFEDYWDKDMQRMERPANYYFYEFGELDFSERNGYKVLLLDLYQIIYAYGYNEYSKIDFAKFISKKTKNVKLKGKTYLDCYKEAMANEIQKNYKRDLKKLKRTYAGLLTNLDENIVNNYKNDSNELEK